MIELLSASEYYTVMQRGPLLDQLYHVGQFFWAPSLYLFGEHRPNLLRSSYSQSRGDYEYWVEPVQRGEFDNPGTPNHTLGIRANERAAIVRAKLRPVILISRVGTGRADSNRTQDECYLVAPVYSFAGDETRLSYSQTFIERVKAYEYWHLFYLPEYTPARIRESFVRLDRIQAIHKNLLEQMPVMLSDDVQDILQSWIRVFLGEDLNAVDGMLSAYRQQAIAGLP